MGSLCECPVENHSTYQVLERCEVVPKRVWHIGAHDGIEANIYDFYKCELVRWFECNPLVFEDLQIRVGHRPNHKSNLVCLWNTDDEEKTFYFYRDKKDGASGLFKPDKMFDYIKDCPLLDETTTMVTKKLDTLVQEQGLEEEVQSIDFLNIDVQGAELAVFEGAQSLLNSPTLKYIYSEVSWDNVYAGAPLLEDISKYLYEYGFKGIVLRKDWDIHGDALYVRS